MGVVNSRALIVGEGTSDDRWRRWKTVTRVRELPLAQCLPPQARLVVIAPHPDDEVLACGGLSAMHAERGGEVVIVAVTDGEASHPGLSKRSTIELAALRGAERSQGLIHLGLQASLVVNLALPDGKVAQHTTRLHSRLLALLHAGDVVVSTWSHDGHPDHDAVGQTAQEVCASRGCVFLGAPIWMWHWATPGDQRVPWTELFSVRISVDASRRKRAALAAHVTQLNPRGHGQDAVLGKELLARVAWLREYYFV